ncbi:MAG: flagellar basal body L-ring protein FlgH [Desulfobacterales bacterium]
MALRRFFILCVAIILVTGCAGVPKNVSKMPETAQVRQPKFERYEPPKPAEGALWSEVSNDNLFSDIKARNIGDVITVRIVEDPEAELNANTKTSRSSSIDAAKLKFLGYMKALAEKNSTKISVRRMKSPQHTLRMQISHIPVPVHWRTSKDPDG